MKGTPVMYSLLGSSFILSPHPQQFIDNSWTLKVVNVGGGEIPIIHFNPYNSIQVDRTGAVQVRLLRIPNYPSMIQVTALALQTMILNKNNNLPISDWGLGQTVWQLVQCHLHGYLGHCLCLLTNNMSALPWLWGFD